MNKNKKLSYSIIKYIYMGVFSMIILNKKRILVVIVILVFSFGICLIETNTGETIETVALPVTNKVIVIDAGHRCTR